MNRMIDTAVMPDFSRKIYLVKKDRKGHNDWYELDLSDKTILEDDKTLGSYEHYMYIIRRLKELGK